MCACVPMCFQRLNLVTFAKARPAQMMFITTSIIYNRCSENDADTAHLVYPVSRAMQKQILKPLQVYPCLSKNRH